MLYLPHLGRSIQGIGNIHNPRSGQRGVFPYQLGIDTEIAAPDGVVECLHRNGIRSWPQIDQGGADNEVLPNRNPSCGYRFMIGRAGRDARWFQHAGIVGFFIRAGNISPAH